MGAVVQGQALGGIFAAASNVIMLSCGNAVTAAFADFLVAIIFTVSVELVSKELNYLAAILHVYAGGLNFMK